MTQSPLCSPAEPRERPILFSGPMVRALLSGTKTQTRRAMRIQPYDDASVTVERFTQTVVDKWGEDQPGPEVFGAWWADGECGLACPYGKPGDRLYVREAWAHVGTMDPGLTVYRADYPACVPRRYENVPPLSAMKWKPGIHMFRKNCRIVLDVTEVRVERLQDISETDAQAEGIIPHVRGGWHWHEHDPSDLDDWHQFGFKTARDAYRDLWDSINGKTPGAAWDANPWVWAVSFRILPQPQGDLNV